MRLCCTPFRFRVLSLTLQACESSVFLYYHSLCLQMSHPFSPIIIHFVTNWVISFLILSLTLLSNEHITHLNCISHQFSYIVTHFVCMSHQFTILSLTLLTWVINFLLLSVTLSTWCESSVFLYYHWLCLYVSHQLSYIITVNMRVINFLYYHSHC